MATALAIAEVLAGQERLINQQEQSRLWQQSYDAVAERVSAGKVSPVEQTRATTALATAHLEEKKQERALLAAKDRLAALWGGTGQEFEKAQGQFEIPLLPAIDNAECIKSTPDLQMAAAELESRRALLALEEASRKPDVTVSVGFRRLNIEHQETWVAGISLPLPFFDKRQGTIAEARIRVEKSLAEQKSLEWQMRSRLAQARHEHAIAQAEAAVLIQTALPAAKEAMSAVEEGYRYGKFDYLSVLDAQRTYAELQRRHIEAVASGMKAAVEIGRLTVCNTLFNHSHPGSQTKESNHAK
jgi:cobalt-zinc-cadmium efflux system outer membrane protein